MEFTVKTIGILFTFDMKGFSRSRQLKFCRGLYGWRSSSNYGKYLYIKDGLLSNMKYLKPTKSTIIVSRENARELRTFFKKNKATFDEKIVLLNKDEAKKIGLNYVGNWNKIYNELKSDENLFFSVDV